MSEHERRGESFHLKRIFYCCLVIVILAVYMLNFANVQPLIGVVNAVDGAGAEIQLVKTVNATTIYSGDDVQYTFIVTNIGSTNLYNVTVVDDTLDFVLDPVSFSPMLAPGESNTTLINVTITGIGTLTNIANATGTTLAGLNVTDGDTVTVTVIERVPEIQLVKTVNATTIISGDDVQYTFIVTNIGSTNLYNVTVVDDTLDFVLDPVSFSPMLAPGESNTTLINVTIAGAGTLTNIATANGTYGGITVTDTANVTVTVLAGLPVIESCDSTGIKMDTFSIGDDVYVNGTGFGNATTYSLYVVEDQAWSDGLTIPARVSGTATTVTSLPDGTIPPTLVWPNPLVPGKYDIVVDVNNNTKYDVSIDALDDNDIEVTAGFFIIPEVAIGSVMAIASMFTAFIGYIGLKRHRTK